MAAEIEDGVSGMAEIKNKFSVVVPVLNSKNHLRGCLNSIRAAMERYGNAELIVLDNGSDDGSYEILRNEYARWARVEQIREVTVSALRNRGAELSSGEFIAFIDSDCLIGPDYFEQALSVLRGVADATGSEYALEEPCHWIQKVWYTLHVPAKDGIVNYIVSGNLVIKRQALLAVGGFDEKMVSCEDNDLGLRLNRAGFKVCQAHAIRALHPGGEQNLRVFFRKTAWRSMGMFQMMKHSWLNKPLIITLAHLVLVIAAIANLFGSYSSLLTRAVVSLLLVNLAPALTVLFYVLRVKRLYAPMRSMLLYHLWFLARFYAIGMMLGSMGASRERKVAIGARLHSPAHTPE
jgi:glycosyltransferase involved in cell wall biosynthesis